MHNLDVVETVRKEQRGAKSWIGRVDTVRTLNTVDAVLHVIAMHVKLLGNDVRAAFAHEVLVEELIVVSAPLDVVFRDRTNDDARVS